MTPRTLMAVLATLALAFSAGCLTGGIDTGDGDPPAGPDAGTDTGDPDAGDDDGGGNAQAVFNQTVQPILQSCSGVACHEGPSNGYPSKFLGENGPDGYYAAIVEFPTVHGGFQPGLAGVITKVDVAGGHEGNTYTPTEIQTLEDWLLAEREARGLDDGDPPPGGDPLAEWSGCMTLENWEAAGMGDWALKTAEGGTVCSSCHGSGLKGFDTNVDSATMFARNKYEVFITGFFAVQGSQVVPARSKLQAKAQGTNNHPTYSAGTNDPHMQALQQFTDLTNQAKAAGACGPAVFPQP